ncbi:MAG: alpha/beta hydrolase [Chloroflexota bacterium]|nr:MAG: alpha/beta hydrolase [Chloroflexota bacterium]
MQEIILQGERLVFTEGGAGRPLVLLHAGIADSRMWRPQFEALGNSFHLIAPDLRGFGDSPYPNGPFAYHEDVAGLIAALDLEPAWLVGVSFGSRVALDLCLAHPDLVRGLVLVSLAVAGFDLGPEVAAFGREEDRLLENGDLQAATELNLRTWVDGPFRPAGQVDPEVRAAISEMQLRAFQATEPENAEVIALEPAAANRLDEIRIPTLIVAGELDVPAVVEQASALAEAIDGAQLQIMPGTAHMPTMEAPAVFNALLVDFVE